MPLCRGLGFQVTPSPRSVQCTLTGGNAQWSISSRTVLNFDLFSGTLFLDIGSVRQRNFTPDFEIKVLCDIFLLLSAITWCFSSLLSTRAYAQRFARFFKLSVLCILSPTICVQKGRFSCKQSHPNFTSAFALRTLYFCRTSCIIIIFYRFANRSCW